MSDINSEIIAYVDYNPDVFRGKTILLPCDDPEWSNFTKFCKIFEYVLGGETDTKLLEIRIFNDGTKETVYERQTEEARRQNKSNCPHCALENNSNSRRIYGLKEMEADHVTAWSNGGNTSIDNCQVLCITHNRLKGNR